VTEVKPSQSPENKLLKKHEIKQEKMVTPPPSGRKNAGPDLRTQATLISSPSNLLSANMGVDSNVLPHALEQVGDCRLCQELSGYGYFSGC
jgi:hypothetical protein